MTKLWSMFFFCVLLVATMNWYAVVREPDVVAIDELQEHVNSVVKVRGKIVSWIEDPWGSGDSRMDIIISDGTGVVEIRWMNHQTLPPVGSTIEAVGDVISYMGYMYIMSVGSGSVSWDVEDVVSSEWVGEDLTTIAMSPEMYAGRPVTISGHISKTLNPDARTGTFDLRDHPEYTGSNYFLKVLVFGSTDKWIESSSKVNVTGVLSYSERDMRWVLYAQGNYIEVDNTYQSVIATLDWNDPASWQYEIYSLVSLQGKMVQDTDGSWWIEGSGAGERMCALPSAAHLADDAVAIRNMTQVWIGRYMWPENLPYTCIVMGMDAGSARLVTTNTLFEIINNPHQWLDNSETVVIEGWLSTTISPTYDEGAIGDGPSWDTRTAELSIHLSGSRERYLEEGLYVRASGTVVWDVSGTQMVFEVDTLIPLYSWTTDGTTVFAMPLPAELSWFDGPTAWFWDALGGSRVYIEGHLNLSDGTPHIEQAGTDKILCLILDPSVDAAALVDPETNRSNTSLIWIGRLFTQNDAQAGSINICMDIASPDVDRDMLGFEDELFFGTDPEDADTDDDGVNDGDEVAAGSDPLDPMDKA